MNILAIGAHPDDVEIACGATLAKHAAAGDYVTVLHLGTGCGARAGDPVARQKAAEAAWKALVCDGNSTLAFEDGLADQMFDTTPLLELTRRVERAIDRATRTDFGVFDVVYTHHEGDLNMDHALTARAVKTAFRPKPGVRPPKILAFEVLSTTELGAGFCPNVFTEVSPEMLERKVRALQAYGDEIPPAPHPRSIEAVRALATLRGAAVGKPLAEAFMLVREVL